jgi:predicted DNA-binding transcriptional regulator YafY
MRRADRLFEIVQLIRGRRLSTAAFLAERLEVSLRTVYRDVADLQAQGVPIEGEAGVGYRLGAGYDLPPLMFSAAEAKALVACVRLAQSRLDRGLASASESALSKIIAVLPTAARAAAESLPIYAPAYFADEDPVRHRLERLRGAIEVRRKLQLAYRDEAGRATDRIVRPLGCFYWGAVWTLGAWCEQRDDFRSFRVDRIADMAVLDEPYRDEVGKTLADFLRTVDHE